MKKLLMVVYNRIEVDGRVKRAAASLSQEYNLNLLSIKGTRRYSNSNYEISRVNLRSIVHPSIRLLYFWFTIAKVCHRVRPRVLYGHDFFLPFPCWIIAKLYGCKLVYDAHELIVPTKHEHLTRKEGFFYFLEKLSIGKADLVISANVERARVMQDHYSLQRSPVSIRNIPIPTAGLIPRELLLQVYPMLEKKNYTDVHVVYMGDIALSRGLDVLLEGLAHLPDNYKLLFVGDGPDLQYLKVIARQRFMNRAMFTGGVLHEQVQDIIKEADIGILIYSMIGLNNILCAPNKIYEYAHAGLPILATCQPPIRKIIEDYKVGETIQCESEITPENIAAGILKISAKLSSYRRNLSVFLETNKWRHESVQLKNQVNKYTK